MIDASAFDDRPRGACRRSAPQPRSDFDRILADYLAAIARHLTNAQDEEAFTIHESDAAAESYWPLTVADDWCGEYIERT
ncbi:MAG TPA: hypothetical protein VEQ35_05855 [Beijerinckia sp.]|nr:hypothetical protein [Beijerinckia sp.]